MSPIPTLAETVFAAILLLIFIELLCIGKSLKRIAIAVEDEEEEERLPRTYVGYIECPICSEELDEIIEIKWRDNEPDVGDCLVCHTVWQNHNTIENPHLRRVRLP